MVFFFIFFVRNLFLFLSQGSFKTYLKPFARSTASRTRSRKLGFQPPTCAKRVWKFLVLSGALFQLGNVCVTFTIFRTLVAFCWPEVGLTILGNKTWELVFAADDLSQRLRGVSNYLWQSRGLRTHSRIIRVLFRTGKAFFLEKNRRDLWFRRLTYSLLTKGNFTYWLYTVKLIGCILAPLCYTCNGSTEQKRHTARVNNVISSTPRIAKRLSIK